jgi:hypothetical protein
VLLPHADRAEIAAEKLRITSCPTHILWGGSKRGFAELGLSAERWQALESALRLQHLTPDAEPLRRNTARYLTAVAADERQSTLNVFVTRCWTSDELDSNLRAAGFDGIAYFGAYDPAIAPGSADRLISVAQRM